MTEEIIWMAGHELARNIQRGAISSVEAVTAVLEQLDKVEPHINAFVTVVAEQALQEAKASDERRARGESSGAIDGVPITVKDLTATAGVRTTYGTEAFADHVPDVDDISWARLKAAGAILIGKTTTPDFGMLGVTDSKLTGRTSTPWAAPTHTSGGSSGGAAASVAAGVAPFAWGSDGGGSIRIPAACCGVVGLKSSPGRIPCGLPAWDTTTVVGPLTRNVRDAALLLDVTSGPHPSKPHSLPDQGISFEAATVNPDLAGLRFGYSPDQGSAVIDPEVLGIVETAVRTMEGAGGADVDSVELHMPDPIDYFSRIYGPAFAEALEMPTPNGRLKDFDVHPATLAIAERGRAMSALEYWETATGTREEILNGFLKVFERHDLLVTPTMPLPAFPHPGAEAGNTHVNGIPVRAPSLDFHRLTEPPSHAMLPAISVNCGFTATGLPVGMQIIGPQHADYAVLRAAAAYEAMTDWSQRRPPIA